MDIQYYYLRLCQRTLIARTSADSSLDETLGRETSSDLGLRSVLRVQLVNPYMGASMVRCGQIKS
jgi:hypothetical protein